MLIFALLFYHIKAMSFYFDFNFTPIQIALLALLFALFCIELVYLYFIYHRVAVYARKAMLGKVQYASELPSVSVVVIARDEEGEQVLQLLPHLVSQEYPDYEVIVVNDGTSEVLQNAISLYECDYKNVYQTFVPDTVYNVSRRKLGITLGIKAAKNDVVILTDANCMPQSNRWIYAMARNFVPGVDVVLGYTRMAYNEGEKRGYYQVFDRMIFALRYLAYAVMKRPFMGVGSNLAYRRDTFFANKGFSARLNLHFGDDDLLVNEIARKGNTRIEMSAESIVESHYADKSEAWNEMRMKYNFTSKYLHTSSKGVFAFESVLHILLWIVFAAAVVLSLPNMVGVAFALLIMLIYWLLTWRVYLSAGVLLGERCAVGLVPLFQLVRPWYALYYAIVGRSCNKSNFTWQYLR